MKGNFQARFSLRKSIEFIKGSDPLFDGITFTVALEMCTPPRDVYMYTFLSEKSVYGTLVATKFIGAAVLKY